MKIMMHLIENRLLIFVPRHKSILNIFMKAICATAVE